MPFPRLQYQASFLDDFDSKNDGQQRYQLQETLAKVAYLLDREGGDTSKLRTDNGLQYSRYQNVLDGIDHFRVDVSRRVSCKVDGGNLILRHCGPHDYVNDNP